jgi:hypothetical protein
MKILKGAHIRTSGIIDVCTTIKKNIHVESKMKHMYCLVPQHQ